MEIKRIKASNFKTYRELDLDISVSDGKSIILIGGTNGGGKTTLFDAIYGALYGLNIKTEKEFFEILSDSIVKDKDCRIVLELTFTGFVLSKEQTYIIKRTYALNPESKPVENVRLNMGGTVFEYGSAQPMQQKMEQMEAVSKIIKANLPEELSKYFLFDAMIAGKLLDDKNLEDTLKDNFQNVMGFAKYGQLSNVSEQVKNQWTAERIEQENLRKEYEGLLETEKKQDEEIKALQAEYDKAIEYSQNNRKTYDDLKSGKLQEESIQENIRKNLAEIETVENDSKVYLEDVANALKEIELDIFVPRLSQVLRNELQTILKTKNEIDNLRKNHIDKVQLRDVVSKVVENIKADCPEVEKIDQNGLVEKIYSKLETVDDKYSFLDEEEVNAIRNVMNSSSSNKYVRIAEQRGRLNIRIENASILRRAVESLRGQLTGNDFNYISAYDENEQKIVTLDAEIKKLGEEHAKTKKRIQSFDVQSEQGNDPKYELLKHLPEFFNDVAISLLKSKKYQIEERMKMELNKNLISHKGVIKKVEMSESL